MRTLGGFIGMLVAALIGAPLWAHPPSTVPLRIVVAAGWIGAALGSVISR